MGFLLHLLNFQTPISWSIETFLHKPQQCFNVFSFQRQKSSSIYMQVSNTKTAFYTIRFSDALKFETCVFLNHH